MAKTKKVQKKPASKTTKKAAQKKAGTAKSARKSSKTSAEDIVALILADHKPLWDLIDVMKSEDASVAKKKKAFEEFAPKLVAHAKPEEQTWYENMKEDDEMKTEGIEGDIEHRLADQLCEELKSEADDDVFEAKVKVLAELVEHHLEEEEEEMLPEYKKESTLEEREELGRRYLELQSQYLN